MEFQDKIRQKLLMRGFTEKQIFNNRGLIGATLDETILEVIKGTQHTADVTPIRAAFDFIVADMLSKTK